MASTFTVRAAPHVGWIPVDDEGAAWLKRHAGELAAVKVSQPRSLEQNAKLWAVAEVCYQNLPEHLSKRWPNRYKMVKALQLRLGLVDSVATWDETGWKITATPSSIAEMDHAEANEAVNKLFDGMALLLGVTTEQLLSETSRRAA